MLVTAQYLREFVRDKAENNYLIEGEEVSDTAAQIAMDMTISDWNSTAPTSSDSIVNFPYPHILLSGALYRIFMGQCALFARNSMSYSDGGLTIPISERFELYQALASLFQADYQSAMTKNKIRINLDQGWGSVSSDYSNFPIW